MNLFIKIIQVIKDALFGPESHSAGRYPKYPPVLPEGMTWDQIEKHKLTEEEQKFADLLCENMPETYFDEFGRVCYKAKKDGTL